MATPSYMKRIAFLDGQVLHDFHLNMMQKNIAEAIKEKTTKERYDLLIMTSNYHYYFCEPFINEKYKDSRSTADLNRLTFTIYEGDWMSTLIELPSWSEEFYLYSNFEDYPSQGATVEFFYRLNGDDLTPWTKIDPDKPVNVGASGGTKYLQFMVRCNYTGTIRPTVYDYAVFVKDINA